MRCIEALSEDEMVAAFLRAEIDSTRFGAGLRRLLERDGVDPEIVERPDTTCTGDNAYRLWLLGEFRGYRENRELFEGFPDDVTWQRVALRRDELLRVKYIDYSYWVEISGGSRLPADAAKTIRAGGMVFGRMSTEGFLHVEEALRLGATFPELICVRAGNDGGLVVLEGHVRLTAYALAPEALPEEVTIILGTSPGVAKWSCY